MKIDIHISDCTPGQAAQMFTFLSGTDPQQYVPAPADGSVEVAKPAPTKRPRRTKAEMMVAAQAEAEAKKAAGGEAAPTNRRAAAKAAKAKADPTPSPCPRRDNASTATPAEPAASGSVVEAAPPVAAATGDEKVSPEATGDPLPDEGDVNDADVAKAASMAAQTLGRDVVMGVLEGFGVTIVSELDQTGRADFLSLLDQKLEDHKSGQEIPF